jgi:hypothetical protein
MFGVVNGRREKVDREEWRVMFVGLAPEWSAMRCSAWVAASRCTSTVQLPRRGRDGRRE